MKIYTLTAVSLDQFYKTPDGELVFTECNQAIRVTDSLLDTIRSMDDDLLVDMLNTQSAPIFEAIAKHERPLLMYSHSAERWMTSQDYMEYLEGASSAEEFDKFAQDLINFVMP